MALIIILTCVLLALYIVRYAFGKLEAVAALDIAYRTDIGKRQINADGFEWSRHKRDYLLTVADGIGSGTKGRTATLSALDSVVRTFEVIGATDNPVYFFRRAFRNANDAVMQNIPDGTAGANLLCSIVKDGRLYYALAGLCQVSVLRRGELIPLSEGQTLDVLAKNAFRHAKLTRQEAQRAYKQKRVYNYVGKEDYTEPEVIDVPVTLQVGDCIVMMSDGVTDAIPQKELEAILNTDESSDAQCENIISWLHKYDDPEQDNATIVLARVNRL